MSKRILQSWTGQTSSIQIPRLCGEPVFVGTRVSVMTLLVYLESGETLEEFLDNFPTVTKEQAIAFLEEAGCALLAQIA